MRLVLALTLAVAGCTATSDPVGSAKPGQRWGAEKRLNAPAAHAFRRRTPSSASRSQLRAPIAALFQRLALCESGGRWHIHGYFDGGLQFLPSTWVANGGLEFAPRADLASKAEQITVALRLLRTAGWSSWPVCSVTTGIAR